MELSLQAKLLRVLEESRFRRVGGLKDLPLDVRIVAASNLDLKTAGEEGKFRLDLYFRLSIIQVNIPPLRDRGDDVLLLAEHYIEKANLKRREKRLKGLDKEAAIAFRSYRWPGNVRELRNVIERASILEESSYVTVARLPPDMLNARSKPEGGLNIVLPPDGVSLNEVENELSRQAFQRTGGNLSRAARLLGVTRDQLRYRLRKADGSRRGNNEPDE
jgi:two-component system, NtrC family, response regulator AtoC